MPKTPIVMVVLVTTIHVFLFFVRPGVENKRKTWIPEQVRDDE